jgi:hypothetical protein
MDLPPRNLVRDKLYLTAYFLLFRSVTRNSRRDREPIFSDAIQTARSLTLEGDAGPSAATLSTELRGTLSESHLMRL